MSEDLERAMASLSKPDLPPGPHLDLIDALHELHHEAGYPSLRDLGREIGVSRTTISAVFSDVRLPRWGTLELLVESLGGDTARFHELWMSATTPAPAPRPALSAADLPHQLPVATAHFVGREGELASLDRLRDATDSVAIAVVSGAPGVGKSALVAQWAHRHRAPDGELYLNLRGYDAESPVEPAAALEELLRAMGVEDRTIPSSRAGRAALWRTTLAGRRVLLLLDNARSVDQVKDLLPGTAGSVVLVTSRDSLPGLVLRYGAVRLDLGRLPEGDAIELIRELLGERAAAEPEATAALAEQGAYLPIALRIAAERAASRPQQTLAALVAELDEEADRLDLLDLGDDEGSAVRTVFSWSAAQLGEQQRRAFRLLGVPRGRDVDVAAAAALLDTDRPSARALLLELARLHLLEPTADGFGMHDLLRAYARELLRAEAEADAEPARTRYVDHYVEQAEIAVAAAAPTGAGPTSSTPLGGQGAASLWLEHQRSNLLAVSALAADHLPQQADRLSRAMAGYLDARGHYADALAVHGAALRGATVGGDRSAMAGALLRMSIIRRRLGEFAAAAELDSRALDIYTELGDRGGRAAALVSLGIAGWRRGHYTGARTQLEEARELYVELGDRSGQGAALYNLGIVHRRLGDYPAAARSHERALEMQRQIGDRVGEGRALTNAGVVQLRLGHYEHALEMHSAALEIQAEFGDRAGESATHTNVGLIFERQGKYDDALEVIEHALTISREISYRTGEGDALRARGVVLGRMGRTEEALADLNAAVVLGREVGEADIETGALNELSELLLDSARADEARPLLCEALALAQDTSDRFEQARAADGLGRAAALTGDQADAVSWWTRALDLFTALGLPEQKVVAARLR